MRKIFFPTIGFIFLGSACGLIHSSQNYPNKGDFAIQRLSKKNFYKGQYPLSDEAVITYPPFIHQKSPNLCGLAAAQMVAGYYGRNLNREDFKSVESTAKKMGGASGQEMKNLFENSGFEVSVFSGTLGKGSRGIFSEIDRGRPLIVMLRKKAESHYMVLDGYDLKRELVILNDPRDGPIALSIKNFKMGWDLAGRFTLLAFPAESADIPQ